MNDEPVRPCASPALAALRELVDRLGRLPAEAQQTKTAPRTWARLRTEQRLRQASELVPANAGPLNSSYVVHRALQTLREISPEYVEAFMAHVDTLAWLEDAVGGPAPRPAGGSRPVSRQDRQTAPTTRRRAPRCARRAKPSGRRRA